MTILSNAYPLDLTPGSVEQVNQSLAKLKPETEAIYTHLNNIRTRYRGVTAPSNPEAGQQWEDTGNSKVMRWNGSAWVQDIATSINLTNRNTVIQGTVDGSGNPTLIAGDASDLTADLVATTETIIAIPAGHDSAVGNSDYIVFYDATQTDFWTSLPANSTAYLFVDYAAGTVTGTYSVIAPVYQAFAPAHAAGKNWYDTNKEQWYLSDGSNWVAKYRVYVGSVVTDGTKVTATTINPYNDKTVSVTQQAAIDAKVSQTITDGVTDSAPSENAVANAIKLLATLNSPTFATTAANVIKYQRTGLSKQWALSADMLGMYFTNITDAVIPFYASNAGKVGIGTTDPQATLHSTGTTILGTVYDSDDGGGGHVGNGQSVFFFYEPTGKFFIRSRGQDGVLHEVQLVTTTI